MRLWKNKMVAATVAGATLFTTVAAGPIVYADNGAKETIHLEGQATFSDIDTSWARATIERMAENNIINGYTDDTFRPDNSVTQLEAITIIMNVLEEQQVELQTSSNEFVGTVPQWAQEDVNLAIHNGIVTWMEMDDYSKPANRMFAVERLINALDVDVSLADTSRLTFTDLGNSTAEEKAYVAAAIDEGLLTGFTDNTFRPNQEVTRAEITTFAERLFDNLNKTNPEAPETDINMVQGTIANIDFYHNHLQVGSENYPIAWNVEVQIDQQPATFSQLESGMEVSMVIMNNEITKIAATSMDDQAEYSDFGEIITGKISYTSYQSITIGLKNFRVQNDVHVEINGDLAEYQYLTSGLEAVLVVNDGQVSAVYAFDIAKSEDEDAEELEFTIEEEEERGDERVREAKMTGDRVSDTTPDLEDGTLRINVDGGSSYNTIDIDDIDGSQDDGEEVAEELEKAIEEALDDERVKVTFDDDRRRFTFETYDSPTNKTPSIRFRGDDEVLEALGLDDDRVSGSIDDEYVVWEITVESDAEKEQEFEIEIVVEDEDIDETEEFTVEKGDKAEDIAEELADILLDNSEIRNHFEIRVDDEVLTLIPDDDDWDVEIEINEQ